jgi:subtilase family serine protease
MLFFMFYFPSFRISLAMSRAIKRKAYQKAIDIGKKAITTGETSFAIKVNLMAAYYHNNDMRNAKRLLAVIEGNKLSTSEKKIFEKWKQKLNERTS